MDLKLDPITGDLDYSSGSLVFCEDIEEMRQRYNLAIGLNLAQFFSHVNYGVPYIYNPDEDVGENVQYLLGAKMPAPHLFIKAELDRYSRQLDFVESMTSTVTFNPATREMGYSPKLVVTGGVTITFPPFISEV